MSSSRSPAIGGPGGTGTIDVHRLLKWARAAEIGPDGAGMYRPILAITGLGPLRA